MYIVGSIEPYSEGTSWLEYRKRLETFMVINKVTVDLAKTSYLITFSGPVLYSKMREICAPVYNSLQ